MQHQHLTSASEIQHPRRHWCCAVLFSYINYLEIYIVDSLMLAL